MDACVGRHVATCCHVASGRGIDTWARADTWPVVQALTRGHVLTRGAFAQVSQWMRTASMHDGTDPAAALHSFDSELSALQEQVCRSLLVIISDEELLDFC